MSSCEQKLHRIEVSQELLSKVYNKLDPLKSAMRVDEAWDDGNDVES